MGGAQQATKYPTSYNPQDRSLHTTKYQLGQNPELGSGKKSWKVELSFNVKKKLPKSQSFPKIELNCKKKKTSHPSLSLTAIGKPIHGDLVDEDSEIRLVFGLDFLNLDSVFLDISENS